MSNVAVISRRVASILKVLMELLKSFDAMGTRIKVMSPSAINNGQLVPRNALPIDSKLERGWT